MEYGPAVYAARAILGWHFQCSNGFVKSGETTTEKTPNVQENINYSDELYFALYPNPSDGNVFLAYDLGSISSASVQIYDLSGKLLHTISLNTEESVIQLSKSKFSEGLYLYTITSNGETFGTGKFIVK